jgi:prenyl protein peptidase
MQFAFTTVFGWYATFVFLRTGHLGSAVAVHAFCNCLGVPRFGAVPAHPAARLMATAFAAGILLFGCMLVPLADLQLYRPVGESLVQLLQSVQR